MVNMKKLLVVCSLLLISCSKTVVVKIPTTPIKPVPVTPTVYLMCSGKMFKGIIVSVDGSESVYKCPDESK